MTSILIVAVLLRERRRYASVSTLTAHLLLLLYLTNYIHQVSVAMLYRSAKPLVAVLVLVTTFYVVAAIRIEISGDATRRQPAAPVVLALLLAVMSLLDRQGFFLAVVTAVVMAMWALLLGGRRDMAVSAVCMVTAMVVYNVSVGRLLVLWANGYYPSLDYQRVSLITLVTDRPPWLRAGELLSQATGVLAGGAPGWLVIAGLAAICMWQSRQRRILCWRIAFLWALVAVGQLMSFAGMVVRHPPIYEHADHRLWYYALPFQALLLACGLVAMNHAASVWGEAGKMVLNVILSAGTVLNIVAWNGYRTVQLRGPWFPWVFKQSTALKASFAAGRPLPPLDAEYLAFFEFCRSRFERASTHTTRDPEPAVREP